MNKIRSLIIASIFVFSIIATSNAQIIQKNKLNIENEDDFNDLSYMDELDQFQTEQTNGVGIPVGTFYIPDPPMSFYVQVAQSFIPTKQMLTRVELFVGRNDTASHPYTVAIREELTEGNLVETSLDPHEFVIQNYSWVEFDFEDILVNIGQTYYIVCYTENVTDNYYAWGLNNDSESYEDGCAWVSLDEGDTWTNESYTAENQLKNCRSELGIIGEDDNASDMCFKTYGADSTNINIEIIKTGIGISATITNTGDMPATEVEWTIKATGGILGLVNGTTTDMIAQINAEESVTVPMSIVFGLGPITITAVAKASNSLEVSDSLDAVLVIIFVI